MSEHILGSPDAPLKLVEYADFECPYCGMAYPYVKRVTERFRNDLALIFRSFPLTGIHPHALHASQAAESASLQGKFWEMHDKLFEHQRNLEDPDLLKYATEIGLDTSRFERDFSSPAVRQAIEKSVRDARAAGVQGTPTFVLNGKQLQLESFEQLEESVAAALPTASHKRHS